MQILTALDFISPVEQTLKEDIDYYQEKASLSLEFIASQTARVMSDIKNTVTVTPSVRDIRTYFEVMFIPALAKGWTSADISLLESHVTAGFGFTGEEWDLFDDNEEEEVVPCLYSDLLIDGEYEKYAELGMTIAINPFEFDWFTAEYG